MSNILLAAILGVLCIDAQPCVDARALPSRVEPADRERVFTWTDSSSAAIVLGTIAPGSETAVARANVPVRLRVTSADASRRLAPLSLTIRRGDSLWRLALQKETAVLRVDAGSYTVVAESARHQRLEKLVVAKDAVDFVLKLQPLPQMTARVITKTNEPIPGATAALLSGDVLALADGAGRLTFDVDPQQWPETVAFSAAGFGTAVVAIPRARVSADLLDVTLTSGGAIEVALERDDGAVPVKVELHKRQYDMPEETPVATQSLEATQSTTSFHGVEAGTYVVVVRGPEPHQRYGAKLKLADGETKRLVMPLRARRLDIHALYGDAPLSGARIMLTSLDGLWRETFHADETGHVHLELWQLGKLSVIVIAEPTLTVPFPDARTFTDEDEADWTIRVSTREIRGRVVDASSGEGLKEANVALQVHGRYGAVVKTDANGRFLFTSVLPGEHTVSASADGYQHDSVRYTFHDSEPTHELTLPLAPAAVARLTVRDAAGRTIPNAAVLDFAGATLTGDRMTDADGEVTIPLARGATRDAYVIPRDGSFAIARIRTGTNTITVPQGPATVVVTSRTTAQEPIANVWVVVRYNGIPLPFEVQQAIAKQQGAIPVSGADGRIVLRQMPLGAYEMWPVGSPAEGRDALLGLGAEAPVKLVARPGLNEAVLSFAPGKVPSAPQ